MNKLLIAGISALAIFGCKSADPASRSSAADYGGLKAEVKGNNNTVNVTVRGDGAFTSAEGGGDVQTNTPNQATDTKPEIAFAMPGGSAGTGSAQPGGNVLDRALNKVTGWIGGGTKTPLTKLEADALKYCIDCNIAPSE